MKHISDIEMNEIYWKEFFYQSYFYGGIKGKVETTLGVVVFLIGFYMLFTPIPLYAAAILISIGLFESLGLPIKYRMWKIRNGLRDKFDERISFIFEQDQFEYKGPTNEGKSKWIGIKKWKETPKGFLLWPQKRIQFYIPKYSLTPDSISFLRNECLSNISN